jgi:hypothetical protein
MAKPNVPTRIPKLLISPMSLVCPLCSAKPGKVCLTLLGGELEIVHVASVKPAAKKDASAN